MRWTYLLTGFLFLTLLPARAGHSAPKVLLRVHIQTTGEGQSELETSTIVLPPNNEKIQIRTLPELTEQELVDVQPDASGALHLQFNHVGQVALSTVTAENQGRILVVLINGYVVYAPVIDEQITSGELILPHQVNPQLVQELQDVAKHNVREAAKT
jgi:preprotein translocase subunit SecD